MLDDVTTPTAPATTPTEPQQAPAQQPAAESQTDKDYNFRMVREQRDRAEQRARELEEALRKSTQPEAKAPEEDDDISVDDNSFIEGKDYKKHYKTLKKKVKEQEAKITELANSTQQSNAETRLKQRFPDIDNIVTTESLKKLAQLKPAAYRSIISNPNLEDRGELAYEMIKAAGIAGQTDTEDRKIEENKSKPRAAASLAPQAGETPLTRVADYDRRVLTEERKEQLRRQVEEAKKYR